MARFLEGRPVKLQHVFWDDEESLAPEQVSVTVASDGVEVASGDATQTTATIDGATVTVYTFNVDGFLDRSVYTATWDGGAVARDTTWFEVVGGFLFNVSEVRRSDVDLTADKFPAEAVRYAREEVEAEFQRITGRSFTPRVGTIGITVDGVRYPDNSFRLFDGSTVQTHDDTIVVPVRNVQAVLRVTDSAGNTVDGTYGVEDSEGILTGFSNLKPGTYKLTLAYGFESVPADIKRVALMRVRNFLVEAVSGIPDRATSYQPSDGGTYTIAMPGRAGFETGNPEVDEVLSGYTPRISNDIFGGV